VEKGVGEEFPRAGYVTLPGRDRNFADAAADGAASHSGAPLGQALVG